MARPTAPFQQSPQVNRKPDETHPPRQSRRSPRDAIFDNLTPSRELQKVSRSLECIEEILGETRLYLKSQLAASVQTLDTIVFEHDTQVLPVAASEFSLTLIEQTKQMELITGLFCAITVPDTSAAPTITIQNAWAELGSDYVNLNAILNSSAGTGGALAGNYAFLLNPDDVRKVTIVASADFPAGAFLTFALSGTIVPATLGEVLH